MTETNENSLRDKASEVHQRGSVGGSPETKRGRLTGDDIGLKALSHSVLFFIMILFFLLLLWQTKVYKAEENDAWWWCIKEDRWCCGWDGDRKWRRPTKYDGGGGRRSIRNFPEPMKVFVENPVVVSEVEPELPMVDAYIIYICISVHICIICTYIYIICFIHFCNLISKTKC